MPPGRPIRARVAATITRRATSWIVALVPLLLAGMALGLVGEADRDREPNDNLPRGADSTVAAELRAELPEDAAVAVVLWTSEGGELTPQDREAISETSREIAAVGGEAQVAEDGGAALAVVPVEAASATANADAVAELRSELREAAPDGVTVQVTGPAGIQADLAGVFEGADTRLLLVTASVVTVLLIVTYRSPVLWIFPLLVVATADRAAVVAATHVLAALERAGLEVAWDESTLGILSVLVFGAGTNYALLLMSRYRDELRRHDDTRVAIAEALRRTVEPVLASAATVVVGVLALLLSSVPTTRGLGVACAVGVVVAASFVLVVLPALLAGLGRWVFWPRIPRVGESPLADARTGWRRVGDGVAARPALAVGISVLVLAAMAAGLFRVEVGLDRADQFLERPEAIEAAERLSESFPAGTSDPAFVVTRGSADAVVERLSDAEGVVSARPSTSDDDLAQIDVVLDAEPSSPEAEQAVTEVRALLDDLPDTHVGGAEAEALDDREASAADRLLVLPVILLLVFIALVLLLRSLVAPLVLTLAVVASSAAALGVSWWVFTGVFGFGALDTSTPLLAFLFLVALGVDYSIFLVTRAREESRDHGTEEGMLRALAATGGVITSAGVLLAAVFAVLGVLPLVVLAQLGAVVCIGVLLDTLLVRTVVVPAVACLLGDRFWWPATVTGGQHRAEPAPATPTMGT